MENRQKNPSSADVIILVNGPGELSSYVKPTVEALNKISDQIRLILIFTPCPYSTGKEIEIARALPGVSMVINEKEFTAWALWNKAPDVRFGKRGVVVFMGGDILYGKIIAKKLGYPALAYSEAYAKWPKIYKKFMVPDKMTKEKFKRQGFPEAQIDIVGNLMVDSVKAVKPREQVLREHGLDPMKKLISFMPGSREFQVQYTFGFFGQVASEIKRAEIECQFAFIISPYLPKIHFERYRGKINNADIKMITDDQHDVVGASDLVITIPGTNTAEVAVIGTPMVVVFPSASAELIPLEGIYDLIGRIPLLGFLFKQFYVRMLLSKTRFFAIPNIKTGREIVPELKGNISPLMLARTSVLLLKDRARLERMKTDLKASLGSAGASRKIAEEILSASLYKTF